MQALDLAAENLANLNTNGYRRRQAMFQSVLATARQGSPVNQAINSFGVLGAGRLDLAPAGLERTGNALDLGIEGNGFFAVQTSGGTLYTRNGNFRVSSQGQLITAGGDAVLGEQGPMAVPSGKLEISADGTLSVNGAVAGKLRLVEFASGDALQPAGGSYYAASSASPQPAQATAVRQGMIEGSNVNPMEAFAGLIDVQRRADLLQRALFPNPGGLNSVGRNLMLATTASGDPIVGTPGGSEGLGTLAQGVLEQSNVSVVDEFIQMILAQRSYEANSRVVEAGNQMLQQLNNVGR
jgi:flagellar basal body rod protein FlgG